MPSKSYRACLLPMLSQCCLLFRRVVVCAAVPLSAAMLWLPGHGEADATRFPLVVSLPSVLLVMLLVEPKLPRSLPMMTIRRWMLWRCPAEPSVSFPLPSVVAPVSVSTLSSLRACIALHGTMSLVRSHTTGMLALRSACIGVVLYSWAQACASVLLLAQVDLCVVVAVRYVAPNRCYPSFCRSTCSFSVCVSVSLPILCLIVLFVLFVKWSYPSSCARELPCPVSYPLL